MNYTAQHREQHTFYIERIDFYLSYTNHQYSSHILCVHLTHLYWNNRWTYLSYETTNFNHKGYSIRNVLCVLYTHTHTHTNATIERIYYRRPPTTITIFILEERTGFIYSVHVSKNFIQTTYARSRDITHKRISDLAQLKIWNIEREREERSERFACIHTYDNKESHYVKS